MKKNTKEYSLELAGEKLTFEFGRVAQQANGAVLARWGDAVVLATCVIDNKDREGIDFFPLSVDFEERYYAAGFIKHNRFMKREGRPSDQAVLTGRMIDRTLRPCFNQAMRREVQIILTVLSVDDKNNLDILAMNAASMALLVSDIPWAGPIAGLRVGLDKNRQWQFCPNHQEQRENLGNLIVAATADKINMVESEGAEITEAELLAGTQKILPELQKLIAFQQKIQAEIGRTKKEGLIPAINPAVEEAAQAFLAKKVSAAVFNKDLEANPLEQLKEDLFVQVLAAVTDPETDKEKIKSDALAVFEEFLNQYTHRYALQDKKRVDGRAFDQIRELSCQVDVLPRTHGSALFGRGQTQALSVVTLGGPSDQQMLDGMETEQETKRYFHHYNFLPFSTGEIKRLGSPNRREIGHGYIAEKALMPVLPGKEDFPYAIRVVSEILSSNGSSSMASTCGSTLALMAAGVPIKEPVAGIAMGLMLDGQNYEILTDIQGPEDHYGDMDLKVAGTKNGITAIQMDVKIDGVSPTMFERALAQAKTARLNILEKITAALPGPRAELSRWAPRIYTMHINPDKIRSVIGPGGKIINQIIDETGVTIDIEDSGLVVIVSKEETAAKKSLEWVDNLTHEVKPGEFFKGKITRILDFGAFAEILPGQEGLIHISQLADYHVDKVDDVVKIGDIVPVKVRNVDELGRINLSLKDAQTDGGKKQPSKPAKHRPADRRQSGPNHRRPDNHRR